MKSEHAKKTRLTPHQIVESWECELHNREAPSIQTVHFIRRQVEKGESVKPKKTGPKQRNVLTEETLMKVEKNSRRK